MRSITVARRCERKPLGALTFCPCLTLGHKRLPNSLAAIFRRYDEARQPDSRLGKVNSKEFVAGCQTCNLTVELGNADEYSLCSFHSPESVARFSCCRRISEFANEPRDALRVIY